MYACAVTDSRWDRQTDHRSAYLARLIHRLDLSLEPIERHLFAYDGDDADRIEPTLQILTLLPLLGRFDAVPVLRRYAVQGRHWAAALETIAYSRAWDDFPELRTGLDADVLAHRDDAELAAAVDGESEPWTSWARTRPRVRRLFGGDGADGAASVAHRPVRPDLSGASAADLLGLVAAGPGRGRQLALRELGRRGDLVVLDLAEDLGLRNAAGWTPAIAQGLHDLGNAAVPRARTWTGSGDDTLEQLAVEVLSGFGESEDGPYLLDVLTAAATEGAWCAAESPARGLGRLGVARATDALVSAWESTVHSYAREAILEGLRGCAPAAMADGFTEEGLDDCEPRVQEAVCSHAPDTPSARARLVALRTDPFTTRRPAPLTLHLGSVLSRQPPSL
ncbi:hypothetical protein P3T35_007316 [Kitasatospora sp. GP30]|uniref:hypothetical protein n=1 Tax=Kitasatospora sp. GP30 TaxID=3035084 RepID=UPI000C70C628|nr:hypothetical protein [Kitasatospora sp. GP30]MDH6145261.1 hypothetical protein [Kitasatospora sp. GP30]